MPKRIQRRRTRGWHKPKGSCYVGRPGKFGNPFKPEDFVDGTPKMAVEAFRLWIKENDYNDAVIECEEEGLLTTKVIKRDLKGKDLICWCTEDAEYCHADVLLKIANR